jgi:hypothetical protein
VDFGRDLAAKKWKYWPILLPFGCFWPPTEGGFLVVCGVFESIEFFIFSYL